MRVVRLAVCCGVLLLTGAGNAYADLVAAVLPSSRSVQVGVTATAFATIINSGTTTAFGCGIAPLTSVPAAFSYQTTNPATNQITGLPNAPATISPGGAQSFVVAFTPTAPFPATDVQLAFACTNMGQAHVASGINTLLLSASAGPVPDIVALAATIGNTGIVSSPGPGLTGVFAVATANVGAAGLITVSADTGTAVLPAIARLCQTNAVTGQCISGMAPSLVLPMTAGSTFTFGVFVTPNSAIPLDPAANRIFVRFTDAGGMPRGSTSVAVQTQAVFPDVRGIYIGSGSLTQSSCSDSSFNGVFGFTSNVVFSSQAGASFSGSATLTATISGNNFVVNASTLSGTVTSGGQISGSFGFQTFANGLLFGSGTGTYIGSVNGDTLSLQFSGQVSSGGCRITGSLVAAR